jgi:flagellar hook-associated protein 3 FlgL
MRVSTNQIFRAGLTGVVDQQSRLARSQQNLMTGLRVNTAADDPAAAATAATLDHRVNDIAQYDRNIGAARASLEVQELALGRVTDRMHRLREIAIAAENAVLSPRDLGSFAIEVAQIRDEMLDLANSRDSAGRYAFAGYQAQTRPFTDVAGSVVYAGDDGLRELQVGSSRFVVASEPGNRVFEGIRPGNGTYRIDLNPANSGSAVIRDEGLQPAGGFAGNYEIRFTADDTFDVVDLASGATLLAGQAFVSEQVISFAGAQVSIEGETRAGDTFSVAASIPTSYFGVVDELHGALTNATTDAPGQARLSQALNGSIRDLDQSMDHLLSARGRLGARLGSLDSQENSNADLDQVSRQALSSLRDLDYAEAITEFNRYMTGLQAAQQSFARMQDLSLFNLIR